MPNSILVTGGAGFIGSHLIRAALTSGLYGRVIALDALTYAADPARLADCADDPRYVFVRGDIRDQALVTELLARYRPSVVFNLAAETHVDRSVDDPGAFVDANVVGTARLLDAVRHYLANGAEGGVRYIQVSTDEVFGALGQDDPPFTDDSPYRPNSPYAASKAAADHLVRAWGVTYGLPVMVTICSNNYGSWQFPEKLISLMIAKALKGEALPVYGRGEQVRDWLHVQDHAEALLTVASRGRIGQSYVIGGGTQQRNIDVVRSLCAELDHLAPRPDGQPHAQGIAFVADRPGHDFRYALSPGKLTTELGWRPRHDFQAGLAETVAWYVGNQEWWSGVMGKHYDGRRLGLGGAVGGEGR